MRIYIASDHRGIKKKDLIIRYLKENNFDVEDLGPNTKDSVDYPIYAFKVSKKVSNNNQSLGILLCGTGIGMCIAANKVKNIRCAKVDKVKEAILTREHNNANIIAISSNLSSFKTKKIISAFVNTEFSNEERHIRRLEMLEK